MKKLTLIFENFESVHLEKDVGYIPRILALKEEIECEIVCYKNEDNKNISAIDNKVKIIKVENKFISKRFYFLNMLKYITINAKKIDNLMLLHINKGNFWYVFFYKLLNPKGFIYIKFDADIRVKDILEYKSKNIREDFYNYRFMKQFDYVLKKADLLSIETKKIYELLLNYNLKVKDKLLYLPNGFFINNRNYQVKDINEKENIIISIGRFGTYQKNTELLLDSLSKVKEYKNWKVILIGSIENNFNSNIKEFYKNNPHLKNTVQFLGMLNDKNVIYDYLSKSKIFLLTSRYESFALVLTEAAYFGNYIISTDVGVAEDITKSSRIGKIVNGEVGEVSQILNDVIENNIELDKYYNEIIKNSRDSFLAENKIDLLYRELLVKGLK